MRKNLVISTYDSFGNPHYSGGGAHAIHEIAKRLSTKYKITIVAGNYPKAKEKFVDGVHYRYIGSKLFGPKIGQLIYHICLPFAVRTNIHDIWVENFTPPISTSFLPLFTKKPVVGLVHMLSGQDMKRKFKLPFDLIERIGLKSYNNFIVLSKNNQDIIKKVNPYATFLLTKNGVNIPKKLLPFEKRSKKHVLFLGRIEVDQKGLDTLISSYNLLKNKIKFPLVIAGSGEKCEVEKLRKLVNSYNLHDKVNFVGRISGTKKDWYLKHASMVIVPSRFETFSITALESIAYGIPLICSDISGTKWIPNGNALKFIPGVTDSLVDKISTLLSDTKLQENISGLQASTAGGFSWEKVATSYENYLDSIQK